MKIGIIGTGGVGGYFGACLAKNGFDTTFIARGENLKAIKSNGLEIKSINGDFTIQNVNVTDKIKDLENTDLIILGVKAWQIKEIREDIKNILHKDSIILPLQNGVLAYEELSEIIDNRNILSGLCRIISKIEKPGVINHVGVNPSIVFGEMDKSNTPRLNNLQSLFQKAKIDCKISQDIQADLWRKFIAICVSGLLAVSKTTYGEIREIKQTRKMMIGLLDEIFLLAHKIGINIENDFVDKTVSFIDTFPKDSTSSLTRDVLEGKPSEIEYQNGTVVRLAKIHGVDTPINRFVYNCILPMEMKTRGQIK
jgi:2-dehydropantoate 2-reductase